MKIGNWMIALILLTTGASLLVNDQSVHIEATADRIHYADNTNPSQPEENWVYWNDEFGEYLLLIKNPNKSKNNIYLKSKLLIEKIADTYSKLSSIKFLGIRIFQDKKYLKKNKYFVKNKNNKTFSISLTEFNHMINKTLKKKKFKNEIINLCLN